MDEEMRAALERRVHTELKADVSAAVRALDQIGADFSGRHLFRSGLHFQAISNSLSEAIAGAVNHAWDVLAESSVISTATYSDTLGDELKTIVEAEVPSSLFLSTLRRKAIEIGCPELVSGSQEQVAYSWFLAAQRVRSKIDVFVQGRKTEALGAQPPPLLQYLTWFRLHGARYWTVSAIGFTIWAILFVLGYLAGRLIGG